LRWTWASFQCDGPQPTTAEAHALSHRRPYRGGMIPLDLLVALSPTLLLAGLWLADRIRR